MTALEKHCANALRLSDASADALIDEIKLNIEVARADMVRSGVPKEYVEDENDMLVINTIIKYVCSEMGSIESERFKSMDAYRLCLDELRKSVESDAE